MGVVERVDLGLDCDMDCDNLVLLRHLTAESIATEIRGTGWFRSGFNTKDEIFEVDCRLRSGLRRSSRRLRSSSFPAEQVSRGLETTLT